MYRRSEQSRSSDEESLGDQVRDGVFEQGKRRDAFILRIWWEDGASGWRGWVQHISTGRFTYVRTVEGLLAFIQRFTSDLTMQEDREDVT